MKTITIQDVIDELISDPHRFGEWAAAIQQAADITIYEALNSDMRNLEFIHSDDMAEYAENELDKLDIPVWIIESIDRQDAGKSYANHFMDKLQVSYTTYYYKAP